jgi:hypothetical protein
MSTPGTQDSSNKRLGLGTSASLEGAPLPSIDSESEVSTAPALETGLYHFLRHAGIPCEPQRLQWLYNIKKGSV